MGSLLHKTICCFFLVVSLQAVAQEEALLVALEKAKAHRDRDPKTVVATLSPFSSKLTDLSWEQRLLFQRVLIEAKSDLGAYSEALKKADSVLQSTPEKHHGNTDYLAVLYKKVFFHLQSPNREKSRKSNERLLYLGELHGDLPAQVQAHLNNEIMALFAGDWQSGLKHIQQAYALISREDWGEFKEERSFFVSKVKYELSRLYRNIRPQEAIRLLEEALILDEASGNKATSASDLNRLAILSIQQENYAAAFAYTQRLEAYAKELNLRAKLMSAYTLLSRLYLLQDDLEQADLMLRKASLHRLSVQSHSILCRFILQRARLALVKQDYALAVSLLEEEESLYFQKQEPYLAIDYYGLLAQGLAGMGQANKAYAIEKQRLTLYKSLQEAQQVRLIQALAVQFDQERSMLNANMNSKTVAPKSEPSKASFSWGQPWWSLLPAALFGFLLCRALRKHRHEKAIAQTRYKGGDMMPANLTLKRLQGALNKCREAQGSVLLMMISNEQRWNDNDYFRGLSYDLRDTLPKAAVWGRIGDGMVLVALPATAERMETMPSLLKHRLNSERRSIKIRVIVSDGTEPIERVLAALSEQAVSH